uniref:F-box/LRR-repeat protein 12-like n=1 Tax=Erigeron canadensis TaxID=72917 RepID=UPI001CB98AB6|nr:F-box/LRR-repeat protein 12-like [Erigeron canadensis]
MDMGVKIQRFCITDLHDEYLYLIFGKLDKSVDREAFGLTCHRFLDIQNSSRKCLKFGTLTQSNRSKRKVMIDSSKLDSLLKRFRQLEFLSLKGCIDVSDLGLTQLQICGSKLHTLKLDYRSDITNKGLSYVASGCPLLSVISLFGSKITDLGLKSLKSCKHLKEVDLACCDKISDSGIQSLIQSGQLRTLDVSMCFKITDIAFQGRSITLEEVDISYCDKITDSGIRSLIQGYPQLRTLNISKCCKITGIGFQGCSPTLACVIAYKCVLSSTGIAEMLSGGGFKYLSFACFKCIEGNGLATIGSGLAPNLKVLDFHNCDFVTDDVILSISQGCPSLQEWNLSYCGYISTSGYDPIGLYCQKQML